MDDCIHWEKITENIAEVDPDGPNEGTSDKENGEIVRQNTIFSSEPRGILPNSFNDAQGKISGSVKILNILKSNKSESSIADLMDVSPADFNVQNMRFDDAKPKFTSS